MTTLSRSAVLPVACLLLPAAATAQPAHVPPGRVAAPVTEVSIQDARWVAAARGMVPAGSIAHGRERDGRPQYICRANYGGGLHLGKVSPGSAGCLLATHGRVVVRDSYQVLTELYTPGSDEPPRSASRRSRWGRSESVVELIRRRHTESAAAKKRVDD